MEWTGRRAGCDGHFTRGLLWWGVEWKWFSIFAIYFLSVPLVSNFYIYRPLLQSLFSLPIDLSDRFFLRQNGFLAVTHFYTRRTTTQYQCNTRWELDENVFFFKEGKIFFLSSISSSIQGDPSSYFSLTDWIAIYAFIYKKTTVSDDETGHTLLATSSPIKRDRCCRKRLGWPRQHLWAEKSRLVHNGWYRNNRKKKKENPLYTVTRTKNILDINKTKLVGSSFAAAAQ